MRRLKPASKKKKKKKKTYINIVLEKHGKEALTITAKSACIQDGNKPVRKFTLRCV
jgi:hypothetical protein